VRSGSFLPFQSGSGKAVQHSKNLPFAYAIATPLSGSEPADNLVFGLAACFEAHAAKRSTFSDTERVLVTMRWIDDGAADRD
jgi:hypothetical protein